MSKPPVAILFVLLVHAGLPAFADDSELPVASRIDVGFSEATRSEPVTGRFYVAISHTSGRRPPIRQVGETGVPLFARNVEDLLPGSTVIFDDSVTGYPVEKLSSIPAGEYWVQPFINVYSKFERADGHTVWLHDDQWEGQNWRRSPGNLYGEPRKIRFDPDARGKLVTLFCDRVIPPIPFPEDTPYVKRFKIRSEILTKWWGRPIYFGATVLLPKGYDDDTQRHYPVNYIQGHFSTRAPSGFGSGRAFDRLWLSDDAPRFIYVTLQHPTPYYDDSYGVNSENNGPYGDAILGELIPEVEKRFRVIREPWARMLSGGSTGGWIALAQQIFYPDFFGGCFASCPDSPDFRYYQIVNIYDDDNAYWIDRGWMRVERPTRRRTDGNIASMMKDENLYELTVGDRSRSGGQWDIWEATYGPVGPDGYPKRIWNKRTGEIDHEVAAYWRDNYDLRHILERDWKTLGPKLVGKLHVYCGDMDSYYLNNGVRMLERFLEGTTDPHYDGVVEYERLRGHCWGPSSTDLLGLMARHIEEHAPEGAPLPWKRQP